MVVLPPTHVVDLTSDNNERSVFDIRDVRFLKLHPGGKPLDIMLEGNQVIRVEHPGKELVDTLVGMLQRAGKLED